LILSVVDINESVLEFEFSPGRMAANADVNQTDQQQKSRCDKGPCPDHVRVFPHFLFQLVVAVNLGLSFVHVRKQVNEVVGRLIVAPP
jgi:hypothetical protein